MQNSKYFAKIWDVSRNSGIFPENFGRILIRGCEFCKISRKSGGGGCAFPCAAARPLPFSLFPFRPSILGLFGVLLQSHAPEKIRRFPLRNLSKLENLTEFGVFRKKCWVSAGFSLKFVNFRQRFGKFSEILKIKLWTCEKNDEIWRAFWMLSGAKACKSCRSRQDLSNEYLLAKFGFDTAENEPLEVLMKWLSTPSP